MGRNFGLGFKLLQRIVFGVRLSKPIQPFTILNAQDAIFKNVLIHPTKNMQEKRAFLFYLSWVCTAVAFDSPLMEALRRHTVASVKPYVELIFGIQNVSS